MKSILCVLGLFTSMLFSSCQKEITGDVVPGGSNNNTNNSSSLVKTYTEDVTTSTFHIADSFALSYDSKDRITSMVSLSTPGDKFVYQYNANNTYTMDLYESNAVSIHQLFFINSIGFVDSTFQKNNTGDSSSEKYIYDANKLLVQLKEYDILQSASVLTNTTNYTYDNSQNIIKQKDNSAEVNYEYYPNLLNNLNVGMIYFPANKNLTKATTVTRGSTETLSHSYTFDSQNRITSEKIVSNNGVTIVKKYTY